MTSATDELRKLLDERGVEYEAERIDFSNYSTWGKNDCYSYTEYPDGTVLRIWDCTPEQAIAATLGNRTLTAEQVREAVEEHTHDFGYDWQAIADELDTEAQAIAAWNTRADGPADCGTVEDGASQVPQSDSRERLEADVRNQTECSWVTAPHWKVIDWLDRQAAITERECIDQHIADQIGSMWKDEKVRKLQDQVDSLTAERDHFRKHVDQLVTLIADIARKQPYTFDPEAPYSTLDTIGDYLDELQGDVASLRAERDELRERLGAMTAALDLERIDELQAIVDSLTAERDHLAHKLEQAESICMGQRAEIAELTAERDELLEWLRGDA